MFLLLFLTTHNNRTGSLQLFIKSPFDLLKSEDNKKAQTLISKDTLSSMYLFYYIFGQWDTHPGNQIIALDPNTGKGYLALIDNGAISNTSKVQYGDYAFVRRIYQEIYGTFKYVPFPYKNPIMLSLPTTPEQAKKELNGFKISQEIINRWNSYGVTELPCVVWKNSLWIKFYANGKTVAPNYTNHYPPTVIEKFQTLNKQNLKQFFSEALEQKDTFCTPQYLKKILKRKDEIVRTANNINANNN